MTNTILRGKPNARNPHVQLMLCLAAVCGLSLGVFAAGIDKYVTTGEGGRKIITIPSGADYTLTADDVASLDNADIEKRGMGWLRSDAKMKDYTGNIYIKEGRWGVKERGALGTGAGATYVDGGTIGNYIDSPTNGSNPGFPDETIHLKGTGCENWGSIINWQTAGELCNRIVLDGDTMINTSGRTDFRNMKVFNMNGYTLTKRGNNTLYFVSLTCTENPGNIVVETGGLQIESKISNFTSDQTITVKSGASFSTWSLSSWLGVKIVFEDGARLGSSNNAFNYDKDNRGILSGQVVLNGAVTNEVASGSQVQFRGAMSGEGGVVAGSTAGGYLQFIDPSAGNAFKGGVAAKGVVNTDGSLTGGIVVYRDKLIPADGGPITLNNAIFETHNPTSVNLPGLVVNGAGQFKPEAKLTTATVKSIIKTGEGVFNVDGLMTVKGATTIDGGTLRFGKQLPDHLPGLFWAGNTAGSPNADLQNEADMLKHQNFKGVDATGMTYAYNGVWPTTGKGFYHYTGYFKVPGEAGTSKRCRFSSCVYRYTKVWVDGTRVLQIDDSKVVVPSGAPAIGWSRHYWSDPVMLTAGWHRIAFYMCGDGGKTDNGAQPVTGDNATKYGAWPAKFGLGVDFDSTATLANDAKKADGSFVDSTVTDSSRYTKFTDPGDGSFLRAKTEGAKVTQFVDAAKYRPTFEGPVAVAGGATLDLNDFAPYTTLTIPSLTGQPTIKNGAVNVASATWTLRAGDIASGKPLTLVGDATLTFAGGKTVTVDGDPDEISKLKGIKDGKPIFTNAAGYTFTISPRLDAAHCSLVVEDGTLKFCRQTGLAIIIR